MKPIVVVSVLSPLAGPPEKATTALESMAGVWSRTANTRKTAQRPRAKAAIDGATCLQHDPHGAASEAIKNLQYTALCEVVQGL